MPPHVVLASAEQATHAELPAPWPRFVKPRGEGTAKGIHPGSRVEDRAALAREVERIVRLYRQPALVEAFLPGAEYTVTVVGHDPPRALPVLPRALEREPVGRHPLHRHVDRATTDQEVTDHDFDLGVAPGHHRREVDRRLRRDSDEARAALRAEAAAAQQRAYDLAPELFEEDAGAPH